MTDRFAGTAAHYAAHRPNYGPAAIEHVRDRFDLDRASTVLDLGCGTGQIALALAGHVGHVVGMDPERAMVMAARDREQATERPARVDWVVAGDEQLRGAMGPFDCTTIGRAFHWMDQERTLSRLREATAPGGGIALLGDVEWLTHGEAEWQAAVYEVAAEFVPELPARVPQSEVEYDEPYTATLRRCGLRDVEEASFRVRREWTVDAAVGYCLSLSFCSPSVLGEERAAFETAVRERLAEYDHPLAESTPVTVVSGRF